VVCTPQQQKKMSITNKEKEDYYKLLENKFQKLSKDDQEKYKDYKIPPPLTNQDHEDIEYYLKRCEAAWTAMSKKEKELYIRELENFN